MLPMDYSSAIDLAERKDARRRPTTLDRGPDCDENDVSKDTPTPEARAHVPAGEDYDGFWKHSEYLKCRAGREMRDITYAAPGPRGSSAHRR